MRKLLWILVLVVSSAHAQFNPINSAMGLTSDLKNIQIIPGYPYNYLYLYQRFQVDSGLATRFILSGTGYVKASGSSASYIPSIPNTDLANYTISGVSLGGTLFGFSAGYGLTGSMYNGSAIQTWTSDTASSGGLVSKSRLATNLTGYSNRSASQTFSGVPTFSNSFNVTSGTAIFSNGTAVQMNYSSGQHFGIAGNGAFWSGGGFIVQDGIGNLIYNAPSQTFQVGGTQYMTLTSPNITLNINAIDTATISAGHFSNARGTGAIVPNTAAGSGASVSLDANAGDASGTITLTTGTGPGTGTLCTLTFLRQYKTAPHVIVQSTGSNFVNTVYGGQFTNVLTLIATSALSATTAYSFTYMIEQ